MKKHKGVDRLSELPESLILRILSFLEMRDVVKTSLLCKGWKDLWTTIPWLNFSEKKKNLVQTRTFINGVIQRWRGTKILRFRIKFGKAYDASLSGDVDSWVGFATERKVEELYLLLSYDFRDPDPMLGVMKDKYSFSNVKTLQCWGGPIEPYYIAGVVEYFPKVEKLFVDSFSEESTHVSTANLSQKHDFGEKHLESEEAKNQLKTSLMQLKTVEVTWYSYKTLSMFRMIKFVSEHATILQKIVIKKEGNDVVQSKAMILAAQQLLSLQKSFPTIDLIFCQI